MFEGEPQPGPERDEPGEDTGEITFNEETAPILRTTEVKSTNSSAFDRLTLDQQAKIAEAAAAENPAAGEKAVGIAPMVASGRAAVGELNTSKPVEGFQPKRAVSEVYIDPDAQIDRSGEVATGRASVPNVAPPAPAAGEQDTGEPDRP